MRQKGFLYTGADIELKLVAAHALERVIRCTVYIEFTRSILDCGASFSNSAGKEKFLCIDCGSMVDFNKP